MSTFEVEIKQTVTNIAKITIYAEDDDADADAIMDIMDDAEKRIPFLAKNKVEWELDDEEYEIIDVT